MHSHNEWFQPAMELFVTRRRPWVSPVPGSLQFDGNPPIKGAICNSSEIACMA
jgi:hypothetical protein